MTRFVTLIFSIMTLLGAGMHADEPTEVQKNVIILLGPPGSGKGTQAVRITKELGIPHISTGDLFRDNIRGGTSLGKKAKSYMDAGKLVPDDVVLEMLFDRISQPDSAKGFLLDGFPRTVPQAEAFDKYLSMTKARVVAFNLEVPDDVIVERAAGRLTCSQCGHVHNKSFSPSTVEGKCDKCGGELIQREDDQPEVVKERLRVYNKQTKPLIQYYKDKGVLTSFDGTKTPQQVYDSLMEVYRKEAMP